MSPKNSDNPLSRYSRYSAMVVQMIAIILGCVYGGIWLDEKTDIGFPLFAVVLSLFGVFAAIYLMIKQLPRD
ncbi:MAG TPA: AtpZ/AtpI family protein [Bacteroidales bacterium]|nr:AtpZ/AtpI family protein [Bacteroidales bacterium]